MKWTVTVQSASGQWYIYIVESEKEAINLTNHLKECGYQPAARYAQVETIK